MHEREQIKRPNEIFRHSDTFSLDRVSALRQVLKQFKLPFRVVANEGAPYPDGDARVPKGAAFVTYDTGNIPSKVVWSMVDEISPIPMVDGKK